VRGASRDKASIGARIFLSIASPRTSNALDASPSSTRSTSTYSSILDNTRPFAALDAARERQSRNLVSISIVDVSNSVIPRTSARARRSRPHGARQRPIDPSLRGRCARLTHPRAQRRPRPRALAPPPCSSSLAPVSHTRDVIARGRSRTSAARARFDTAAPMPPPRGLTMSPDSSNSTKPAHKNPQPRETRIPTPISPVCVRHDVIGSSGPARGRRPRARGRRGACARALDTRRLARRRSWRPSTRTRIFRR